MFIKSWEQELYSIQAITSIYCLIKVIINSWVNLLKTTRNVCRQYSTWVKFNCCSLLVTAVVTFSILTLYSSSNFGIGFIKPYKEQKDIPVALFALGCTLWSCLKSTVLSVYCKLLVVQLSMYVFHYALYGVNDTTANKFFGIWDKPVLTLTRINGSSFLDFSYSYLLF